MTTLTDVLTLATALADRVGADIDKHGGLTTTETVRTADELRLTISRFKAANTAVAVAERERQHQAMHAVFADLVELIPQQDRPYVTKTHQTFVEHFRRMKDALAPFASHVGKSGSLVVLKIGADTFTDTLKTDHFEAASKFVNGERRP